jgi:small neutral amino acid transporter SnatA (MarC family)
MKSRLPYILGWIAALAALLTLGPIAAAVVLLRSSSDSHGPSLAAQALILLLVLAICAAAYFAARWLTALMLSRFGSP